MSPPRRKAVGQLSEDADTLARTRKKLRLQAGHKAEPGELRELLSTRRVATLRVKAHELHADDSQPSLSSRYPRSVAVPRRILIDWDYGASGLWWCSTKEEHEAPYERWGYLTSVQEPDGAPIHMPELPRELSNDLQAWNDSWEERDPLFDEKVTRLREQGRQLAVRVQEELSTDGWEVLFKLDGRVRRVQPPGSWPVRTWLEELLGYSPRRQKPAEEEAPA